MIILDNFKDIILVGTGAILGVNIRFFIYKKLERTHLNKNYIILLINTISSFCLGCILPILSYSNSLIYSYQIGLFFSIGVLGSLSTFSTFVFDLYELFLQLKFYRAFRLFIISLILGILSFALGFVIFK